jgi:hypothetical protein
MSDVGSRGPQVPAHEELYRALWVCEWWDLNVNPPRVSSFAFKVRSPFSVNIASIIGLEGAIRHLSETLCHPEGGIVSFNCGVARAIGFDARQEIDQNYPENKAHANVYYEGMNQNRKKSAQRLASQCRIVRKPRF